MFILFVSFKKLQNIFKKRVKFFVKMFRDVFLTSELNHVLFRTLNGPRTVILYSKDRTAFALGLWPQGPLKNQSTTTMTTFSSSPNHSTHTNLQVVNWELSAGKILSLDFESQNFVRLFRLQGDFKKPIQIENYVEV